MVGISSLLRTVRNQKYLGRGGIGLYVQQRQTDFRERERGQPDLQSVFKDI